MREDRNMSYLKRLREKAEKAGGTKHPGFAPGCVIVSIEKMSAFDSNESKGRVFVMEAKIEAVEHNEDLTPEQVACIMQGQYAAGPNKRGAVRAVVNLPEMAGYAAAFAAKRIDQITTAVCAALGKDESTLTDDALENIWPSERGKESGAKGCLIKVRTVATIKKDGKWMPASDFVAIDDDEREIFKAAIEAAAGGDAEAIALLGG